MPLKFRSLLRTLIALSALAAICSSARAVDVAYIVNDVNLPNVGDELITEFLLARGYTLNYVSETEDALTTLEASDAADLTYISESVGSGSVTDEVKDSTTPVITAEAFLYDNMGYSGTVSGTDFGQENFQTDITIVNPNHPLAAGLPAGDVSIFDGEGYLGWGIVGGDVTIVATSPNDPNLATLFVYEQGAVLDDGTTAPAMRIGIPHNGLTLDPYPQWTPEGERLFAAAIDYALGIAVGSPRLAAGDADQDLDFDQLDLVKVQITAKYLTGQAASWGEGDWNGAPGGQVGSPPPGNGRFDQLDIIAALAPGHYLKGPYPAIGPNGRPGDAQTSVGYNASTGDLWVDAPAGTNLTSINIDSAAGIFTGAPAQNLGGSFDNDTDTNIFKATFGSSFGSLSFGNVAQTGLSQAMVLGDLTVVGSLAGGGALGNVDLIYVPEPSSAVLAIAAIVVSLVFARRRLRNSTSGFPA